MKIAFLANHKTWGGLANNGGSNTIVKSCQALKRLGHEPHIVTKVNNYTWEKHHFTTPKMPKRPDAVVACSVSDVHNLRKLKGDFCRAYWMRGLERWQMSEEKILGELTKFSREGGRIITNSSWLNKFLFYEGHLRSQVCFAGFNLKFWGNRGVYSEDKIVVGALHNMRHAKTKKFYMLDKLRRHLDKDRYEYVALAAKKPISSDTSWCSRVAVGIHGEELAKFYSYCDVWFAPTTLEGFHNCPAEANLCGALVICNKNKRNGMSDYVNDETALRYFSFFEALEYLKKVDNFWKRREVMKKRIKEHIGSRETNMIRMVGLLM